MTASKAPVALPTAESEGALDRVRLPWGPTTLHDGELVAFENEGFLVHMDVAFPVKNTKNAQKAVKLLKEGKEKAVEKLIKRPAGRLRRPHVPRSADAGDDHRQAGD